MAGAPKVKSKLVELEREISRSIADHIRENTNHRQTVVAPPSIFARFFTKLTMAIVYWRKLITIPTRPAPRGYEPHAIKRKEAEIKGGAVGRASALGFFLISICFGLLVVCGILIAMLFTQIREMKVDIASLKQHLLTADAHLSRLEEIAQQKIIKEAKTVETPPTPPRVPIMLSNDDMKAIRAFIKVLPSQPGAQPKIHLGDEVSNTSTVPVPESLVSQIPKLHGARFLVDQNGAIILIGEGSSRADVVIEPQ
jgi:hypothetical protein